ncbi:TPA: DnaB-like helicase N-terminal domain-containing protein [Legionella anisa]|uniref:DnaB-like helicase N-terminal domain-containing protein n=1 Tax=Legionella anisa TaxID=28082 RepID=UPI002243431B|nr:DnaB-like helicase N-terminal domain-containing protein [Legionella anisa]MCW8425629.1 hypothetical protein [Legionella anisa]MCW8448942.1 hypothetical protein [Legionella anisa]
MNNKNVMIDTSDLEMAIVGCLLMDNFACFHITNDLQDHDFHYEIARTIFSAIESLKNRDRPIDPYLVISEIRRNLSNEEFPSSNVFEIASQAPSSIFLNHYIEELLDHRAYEHMRNNK